MKRDRTRKGERDAALLLRAKMMTAPHEARHAILQALHLEGGNAVRAAKLLGIGHRTLLKYMNTDQVIKPRLVEIRRTAKYEKENPNAS